MLGSRHQMFLKVAPALFSHAETITFRLKAIHNVSYPEQVLYSRECHVSIKDVLSLVPCWRLSWS